MAVELRALHAAVVAAAPAPAAARPPAGRVPRALQDGSGSGGHRWRGLPGMAMTTTVRVTCGGDDADDATKTATSAAGFLPARSIEEEERIKKGDGREKAKLSLFRFSRANPGFRLPPYWGQRGCFRALVVASYGPTCRCFDFRCVSQKKDLHQMAAPTIFSNPLEKWIFHKTKESVFLVDFVPKKDADGKIEEILNRLETVPEDKRQKLTFEDRCCTGFVVDDKSQELKILCSAHCLDHLFTSENPISAQEIGDLYDINIICDHYECSFRKDKTPDKIRYYSRANIVQIDCDKDLILLNVSKKNVLAYGKNGRACRHSHPALVPSKRHLEPMEKVLMVSWPPFRPRTVASGKVSHCDREYADTSKTNLVGYTMTLVEVNIQSEPGGSGAPLLDADANFTGVLHGGADGCSWFISLPDICQALTSWGILTHAPCHPCK
uniref:Peptidase S1 domain-containing protein n=1 Tax=Oryza glumipatula TaxID=40148 RepID=A0A0D9ZU55_9ORYZ